MKSLVFRFSVFVTVLLLPGLDFGSLHATEVIDNLHYRPLMEGEDAAANTNALTLYLPESISEPCPIFVFFHGGNLTGGDKSNPGYVTLAERFAEHGIAVAQVNYRLYPTAHFPDFLNDCAKAVAWVFKHAEIYGYDDKAVFLGGHSAGGYLTAMLMMDDQYLEQVGLTVDRIAGAIPISGEMVTHSSVREERKYGTYVIIADDASPLGHVRPNLPPMVFVCADHDLPCRLEENQLMVSELTLNGHNEQISLLVINDRDHGSVNDRLLEAGDSAGPQLVAFMKDRILPR